VCVAYGLLGFAQLMYNNLGPEGKGIQMLFLFPVPVRTVMLAKNLFHAMLFILVAVISGVLAGIRLGVPSGLLVMTTLAWLAFALPANLAAGNVLSVTMAYRVNLGRIGRQAGSQANALLSMLIQMTLLGVGAAVIAGSAVFDQLWMATPILLALSAGAIFAWLKILGNVDQMANERRDVLMAKLARTE
jgi:ABC-2 type transport system permease protein